MTTISLAMIVKNEEATLAHCLESVRVLVDEMIIVDTGSTDRTVEIAKDFGARIYPFKWCDDFSAARNESLKYVKGDWVLILDADEAIDPLDYEKIKNACLYPVADGYILTQRNYKYTSLTSGRESGAVPNKSPYSEGKDLPFYNDNYILRLARGFDGLSFSGRVHEILDASLSSNGKKIETLDVVIHHYAKMFKERNEHKIHYYLSLARQESEKNPLSMAAKVNLLQQELTAGNWEAALAAAEVILDAEADMKARGLLQQDLEQDAFVLYGASIALQNLGRHEKAIGYLDRVLAQEPEHTLALIQKSLSAEATDKPDEGRKLLLRALELQPDLIPALFALAKLELREKNFDESRRITLDALEIAPHEPTLYDFLLRIEMSRDNKQQAATDAIKGIQMCPGQTINKWYCMAAAWMAHIGQFDTALEIVELGLKTFPGDSDLMGLKGMISS